MASPLLSHPSLLSSYLFTLPSLFSKGNSLSRITLQLDIGKHYVRNTVNSYLKDGYELLSNPVTLKELTLLNSQQEQEFKVTLLTTYPKGCKINTDI